MFLKFNTSSFATHTQVLKASGVLNECFSDWSVDYKENRTVSMETTSFLNLSNVMTSTEYINNRSARPEVMSDIIQGIRCSLGY